MRDQVLTREQFEKRNNIQGQRNSTKFWHYTSLGGVNGILDSSSMYASNASKLNDLNELVSANCDKSKIHIVSFCNSNTEKIPLWYLYAGISGEGASIGLTFLKMTDFINSITEVHVVGKDIILKKDIDFDLQYGWVCYRKNDQTNKIKYRGAFYRIDNEEKFNEQNYFIKDYPWEYEKEFRIVIVNKTSQEYDKIEIKIPDDIYKELRIMVAPEINDAKLDEFLKNGQGFLKFFANKIIKSSLGIQMNLCKNNFQAFIDYLPNYEDDNIDKICNTIRQRRKSKTT